MAKKRTPEELRLQAKQIVEKAKKLETENNAKLGIFVRGIANSGFKETYEELQMAIKSMLDAEIK